MRSARAKVTCGIMRRVLVGHFWLLGCAVAVGLLAEPGVLRAEQVVLPDAATVLDRYVEVTGGQAAYDRIRNSVAKVRVIHVEMDFEDSGIFYAAVPNKRYTEIESEAFGTIRSGTDGNVVWYLADTTGPVVQDGAARTAGLHSSAFNWPGRWRDLYKRVKCVDEDVVEGKACYKLVMTPNEGYTETLYFDKKSGLLVKAETTRLFSGMPPIPTAFTCSDYRRVDGLLVSHKVKQVMQQCGGTRERLFVTDSLEHNVDLPADRFVPPKVILALLAPGSSESGPSLAGTSGGYSGGGSGASSGNAGCAGSGGGATSSGVTAEQRPGGGCGGSGAGPAATGQGKSDGGCGGGSPSAGSAPAEGGGRGSQDREKPKTQRGCCGG